MDAAVPGALLRSGVGLSMLLTATSKRMLRCKGEPRRCPACGRCHRGRCPKRG